MAPDLATLFRTEKRKMTAVLCKRFGLRNVTVAEDIVTDVFVLAVESWGAKGVPDDPIAWLYTAARNRAKNHLRREQLFNEKIAPDMRQRQSSADPVDFSPGNIRDSQLRMIFALSDPRLPEEAQVGLALRILFQLSIDEIAEAFLTNKETINKRLFRAKEKLREAGIELELPDGIRLDDRLRSVLRVLYLLFNQGYASSSPDLSLRKDLCLEALRLNLLLTQDPRTDTPAANALLALMCFHASRFDARLDDNGGTVLYDEQDRSKWNRDLIAKGTFFLLRSAQGDQVDKYHLEAGIADRHAQLVETPDKWTAILALYDRLVLVDPSPMVRLNRAYAVFRVHGAEAAIRETEHLPLQDSPLFHTLLGELHHHIDPKRALLHFQRALNLARNDVERKVISAKMMR